MVLEKLSQGLHFTHAVIEKYCLYSKLHFKMQKILRISYTKILAQGRLKALLCSAYLLRSEF